MEPIQTTFQAFKLSLDELNIARHLTAEQRAYYQTLQADAAEEKLSLKLDPYKPLEFTQQEAYLRGQIDILAMILNSSDEKVTRPNQEPAAVQPQKI